MSGVRSQRFLAFGSAPRSRSRRAASIWPASAATIRAVFPELSTAARRRAAVQEGADAFQIARLGRVVQVGAFGVLEHCKDFGAFTRHGGRGGAAWVPLGWPRGRSAGAPSWPRPGRWRTPAA